MAGEKVLLSCVFSLILWIAEARSVIETGVVSPVSTAVLTLALSPEDPVDVDDPLGAAAGEIGCTGRSSQAARGFLGIRSGAGLLAATLSIALLVR